MDYSVRVTTLVLRPLLAVRQYLRHGSLSWFVVLLLALTQASAVAADDALTEALSAVRGVGVNGQGHEAAVAAMKVINAAPIERIPEILVGMDGANRLSTNWIRSAVISIVGRGGDLPRSAVMDYFQDTSHSHMGRLLAFELLTDGDEELAKSMIPGFINDPSLPLRAMAVEALIEKSKSERDPIAKLGNLAYALERARNVKQVQQISNLLSAQGVKINLQKQLGFLNSWYLVGSFDNRNEAGFDVAYGPEKELTAIETSASYADAMPDVVTETPASWSMRTTVSPTGVVDLNELMGKVKGATVYAYTTFNAEQDREVEIRIGTPNATKIWVNGELVMANQIYHNSNAIDKFSGKAKLKEGENQILIKVCQNEQTDSWAQDWQFQLRICDETGKAIQPVAASQPAY